ncbi:MAG: LysR family transcriptional regulator, partial [Fimbriimonadaceae bacterium]|nr:LysR family transcriptional regulator [Alphaproteobacteria bacterium]
MDQLKSMRTFVSVCDRDGFSAAGKALGISKAVVSKRISELENHLGCRLLQRTTRRHHLTEEGQRYLAHWRATLEDISRVEGELSRKAFRPEGNLRINAALTYGRKFISPLIAPFKEAYPRVTIELSLTDRYVDLVEEGVDMAVRVGGDPNSAMIARRLGETRHGIYA